MDNYHTPVLLSEVVEGLQVRKDGLYIDATLGGGGHTSEILKLGGRVLGIDQDEDSISHIKKKFESEINEGRLVVSQGNFSEIEKIAQDSGFSQIDGILFDLGVSSYQIDKSGRGFSFLKSEMLDMRMSKSIDLTAYEIVNNWSEQQLYEIFAKYGEEIKARDVAKAIFVARRIKPIETTTELSEIVTGVIKNSGKIHPATRIFQALRIAVNEELGSLRSALTSGFKLLKRGGRIEVISFHSLEDRIAKLYFSSLEREGAAHLINKKPIVAGEKETEINRRSRSAKLRIIEKI